MAHLINDSNFDELLANNSLVVVDFSATWCGPCRMVTPVIEELSGVYEGRAVIGKADIEEAVELTEKYGIRSVPTILFFKNGEQLSDKFVGAVTKSTLVDKIESLL